MIDVPSKHGLKNQAVQENNEWATVAHLCQLSVKYTKNDLAMLFLIIFLQSIIIDIF